MEKKQFILEQAWHGERGRAAAAAVLLGGLAFAPAPAHGQAYPERAIRIVVPFPPGAGTDIVARTIGASLTAAMGQPVVVENRPGAGGTVGSETVARAPKDGYTILMGNTSTLAIAPSLYRNLPYNPQHDFAPVARVSSSENVIVVHPSLPARSLRELIALAKARPGQILFSSAGSGTTSHLGGALFKSMAAIDIVHVPYKGSPPSMVDLVAGQVQMSCTSLAAGTPLIKAGRLRALATTGLKRNPILPGVPTVDESGLQGFEIYVWQGFVVPAGTPAAIVNKLNAEFNRALQSSETTGRLEKFGMVAAGTSVEEFAAYIKRENARWADIVRRAGARVD